MEFRSWPSISSFSAVYKNNEKYDLGAEVLMYQGKIKLHGTNACIRINEDNTLTAQSRSRDLTLTDDNSGFCRWMTDSFPSQVKAYTPMYIYGEWCGAGIMKGVAISNINRKVFAIFGLVVDDFLFYEPYCIKSMLPAEIKNHKDVYVLPWATNSMKVDMTDSQAAQKFADIVNDMVIEVEACDPFVKEVFGVEGVGEGLVFYPINGGEADGFRKFAFKAKGEKHSVVKTKKSVEVNQEALKSVQEFTDKMVTVGRLEQAVEETGTSNFDMKDLGKVIKWMNQDIQKDVNNGEADLPEGLEWKNVSSAISTRTREWYMKQAEVFS